MKKLLRTRPIWIPVLSSILAAVLLTLGYAAIAKSRRADVNQTKRIAAVFTLPQTIDLATQHGDDDDPAEIQRRKEYLNRFHGPGPGTVSYADFAASLATAQALPPSPLLGGHKGVSGIEVPDQDWTYPVPPPLSFSGSPSSVRIDAIAVHPGDADTVYVGSEGGLAKTTDGGQHWTILSNSLLSQSIRSIAIDPANPDIVYIGTGTAQAFGVGIYRSEDAGLTWSLISGPVVSSPFTGKAVVKLVVDPNTAGSTTTTTVYASVIHREVVNQTVTNYNSFWRSTNSGSSWTSFRSVAGAGGEPFCFNDIALNPDDPSEVFITAPDGVYMRDAWGGGSSWTTIRQLSTSGEPRLLAFAPYVRVPGATLYLAYVDGNDTKIDKSSSGSYSTWTNIGSTPGNVFCFGVDPAHPNRIYVGGYGFMRYSLDGGANWLSPEFAVHVDNHSLAFCPSDENRQYLGTDGGIYRSDADKEPEAITWDQKNQTLEGILTQGVGISRDDRILIGTQDNGNQISRPAPSPWGYEYGGNLLGGDGWIPFIEFENNTEKIYAVTYTGCCPRLITSGNGFPCRIINGTPSSITPPGGIGEYTGIWPTMSVKFKLATNSDRVIMAFQNVYRSTNSGNNWTRIGGSPCPSPLPSSNCGIDPEAIVNAVYEAPSNSQYIYAVTRDNRHVFMTSNANDGNDADWVEITGTGMAGGLPAGTIINAIAVHPDEPETVYLASNSHVYKTSNPTKIAWEIDDPGTDFIYRGIAFHPADPDKIFVSSHRGVFARINTVWSNMNANLPAGMAFPNLSFNEHSHQLAASAYGRGVYVLDLDRVPPTATVNFPTNGAHLRGAITLLGTAFDNHRVASAQFKLDGGNLPPSGGDGPDEADPNVSAYWNTSQSLNGSHVLTLVVYDPYGNHTTSAGVAVTVDNSPPTVSITEPEDGKKVSGTVTVSANASDNTGVSGVQFTLDGNELDQEDVSAPFSIDWDTTFLRNGDYTLRAIARDAAGNTTTSNPVTVSVSN
ncbi:MAG: Ig-like domain-containing protein [Chthoniobacterales bacterium]